MWPSARSTPVESDRVAPSAWPGARRGAQTVRGESGQAALLVLGVVAVLLVGVLVLFAFGQALGAKGRHQRAADLAAVSAAQVMRRLYPRLFEPVFLEDGVRNPRHLSTAAYLERARAAAVRAGERNGVPVRAADVSFPGGSFAPTRVTVRVHGRAALRLGEETRPRRIAVRARATAELVAGLNGFGMPDQASGGGYDGPLAYRQGKPMRPDVALAFDRLAEAAEHEAGLLLTVISGYRSDAEQAKLFAAHPDPKWVAPPGESLHRYATELDLGPPAAYGWLAANADRFNLVKRYSWEPWH
jgi:D-alanyl-D-alanine carboxypeptidase/Putative Flp pilus-assembly TadE/G-like